MTIIHVNTIPHGKRFVRYLQTRFCIRNLILSRRKLVRFLKRLIHKHAKSRRGNEPRPDPLQKFLTGQTGTRHNRTSKKDPRDTN